MNETPAQVTPQPQHRTPPASVAASTPQRAPTEVDGDVLFAKPEPPTDEEHDTISMWQTPQDAYVWAVNVGACKAIAHAKNSMEQIVAKHGGEFKKSNAPAIYLAFLRHQNEKLKAQPVVA